MSDKQNGVLRKFVYMGQISQGHEYGMLSLENEFIVQRTWLLTKNVCKCVIGGIYEFETLENSVSYNVNQKCINYWQNSKDISEWRLKERMFLLSKKEKKELSNKKLENELNWLNDIYSSCSYSEKTILLAEIIRIITK